MLRQRVPENGPALAHRMRVILRILVLSALFASATASAQPVAEPPAAPAAAGASLEPRDTLLMTQVDEDPSWWETVTSIASGLMTISILVLTAALVPAAWNFRKNHQTLRKMIE